jgi:hypothetical protein
MEIKYIVYCYSCHCNLCQGKDVYVGKSKYGLENRHNGHLKCAKRILLGKGKKKDIRFDYFLAKHGIDNCRIRELQIFLTEEEMNNGEVFFIQEMKTDISFGGMNFDTGGKGGRKKGQYTASDETKQKLSHSLKEYYKNKIFTEEEKEKLSIQAKKIHEKNPELGKRMNAASWKSIKEKCLKDEEYNETFKKSQLEKASKGGQCFLEKFKDESFKEDYCNKVSEAVSLWCQENKEAVKQRAKKISENRISNGIWIESIRNANKKITKDEYKQRIKKGWETRRKNIELNKAKDIENNVKNETETIST